MEKKKKILIPENIPEFQLSIDNMSPESKKKVDDAMAVAHSEKLKTDLYSKDISELNIGKSFESI